MKTPYDSALRVQKRAIDAIRVSLHLELARELAVEVESSALALNMREEATVAALDWQVLAHPYVARQRAERSRLDDDRRRIDISLNSLRGAAMEACGQMQAMAGAATAFATDCMHREASAEQAQSDDFAGARISNYRRPSGCAGR